MNLGHSQPHTKLTLSCYCVVDQDTAFHSSHKSKKKSGGLGRQFRILLCKGEGVSLEPQCPSKGEVKYWGGAGLQPWSWRGGDRKILTGEGP